MKDKDMADLADALYRNRKAIANSHVFLVLFNEKMTDEAVPLIQVGLALYMDKPIVVLCPESKAAAIPDNLRKLARGIATYKDGDMDAMTWAAKKLLEAK